MAIWKLWVIAVLVAAGGAGASPALAQPIVAIDSKVVMVCDGVADTEQPPDFTGPDCNEVDGRRVNPYQKLLWLKADIDVPEFLLTAGEPLGLFVSAKAASTLYLNGKFVGHNGVPAFAVADEVPGVMDSVFYLSDGLVHAGRNELIAQLSGHSGYLKLTQPIHLIAIGPYTDATNYILRGYLPSFLPLGVLIVGALYFGILALRRRLEGSASESGMLLVPLVAFFAACQLVAEVSRGLVAYPYPFHDIRLVLILLFALASGFCLLLHATNSFVGRHKLVVTFMGYGIALIPVLTTRGFDGKSIMAIVAPAAVAALVSFYAALWGRTKKAVAYAIVLSLFSVAVLQVPEQFLDVYYYYVVAGLVLFLFVQQIRDVMQEAKLRAAERVRADRLQLILDESQQKQRPATIKVVQAGKIDLISSDQICFVKGAGDYVELVTADGDTILHGGSLTELEAELPATFLRVHRSYIVNTVFVQALERDSSGSGTLALTNGAAVPVSRRILPKVRKALA